MTKKIDVICIGDLNVDITYKIAQPMKPGGGFHASKFKIAPGGTVANVAHGLAKLGMKSAFVGGIAANGFFKQLIIEDLQKDDVDHSEIIYVDDAEDPTVLIIIDSNGLQTAIAYTDGAAPSCITREDIQKVEFSRARAVHTGGTCLTEEPSRSAVLLGMKIARERGLTTYFDPNLRFFGDRIEKDYKDAQISALGYTDVALIGEEELKIVMDASTIKQGVNALLELGVQMVVIKKGSEGAEAFSQDKHLTISNFDVKKIDENGAGDSFDSGFIAAQLRGMDMEKSLQYASAVASYKVTQVGPRNKLTHEDVLKLLKQWLKS